MTGYIVQFEQYPIELGIDAADMKDHAEYRQEKMRDYLPNGVTIQTQFWIENAILVTIDDPALIDVVRSLPHVRDVRENETINVGPDPSLVPDSTNTGGAAIEASTTWQHEKIRADAAWDEYDTKGAGARVAVLDTGINADHEALELYTDDPGNPTYPGGWTVIDSSGTPKDDPGEPTDEHGHGTTTSGIACGTNAPGTYVGIAPDAELIHGAVAFNGQGSFSQIIGGIEWAVANDADVISISLGEDGYYSTFIDPIRNAESQGVVVISSIGNSGEGASSSPGNDYDSLGVGAVGETGSVTSFSSGELVTAADSWGRHAQDDWPEQYIVPSVVAPGSFVPTTGADGGYVKESGTSMSAPSVAGAVALIQSAVDRTLSPDEIIDALHATAWKPDDWDESTASNGIDGRDTRYGHGIIDVHAAIDSLKTMSSEPDKSKTISIDAGSTANDEFNITINDAGDYDVRINDTVVGTVTVNAGPNTSLQSGDVSPSEMRVGEDATVSFSVENTGDVSGDFQANLFVEPSG